MVAERALFERLIDSVADGGPIDWQELEAAAPDDGVRRRLRDLRLVAEVGEVHRLHFGDAPVADSRTLGDVGHALGQWGHLILIEKIGEGSFGEVYRARDPWLDWEVALKLLKPSATSELPASRVVREAQALARVRHPNVVLVHGAAVHENRVGFWMELLRGRTLEELLTSHGPFGAIEAAVAGQELCRAVAAVHAAGLVHRDIKAKNVMREPGGRLVLMDFGAGQRRDLEDTGPVHLVGTPLYLAPEVLAGGSATVHSDIYSLGVLLYHLVTGEYPVTAESMEALRDAQARSERRRLSDTRPDLPDGFISAVEWALKPDPEQRCPSAGELQQALSRVVSADAKDQTGRVRPRWRGLLLAAAIGVCLALAGAVWWPRSSGRPPVAGSSHVAVLAVLPFQNQSADPAEAYLASAVPMELTARLARIGAMKVVPWTFTRQFNADPRRALEEVSSRTGADAIVVGVVQRAPASQGVPGPVQVHVQILAASTGGMLWSASFRARSRRLLRRPGADCEGDRCPAPHRARRSRSGAGRPVQTGAQAGHGRLSERTSASRDSHGPVGCRWVVPPCRRERTGVRGSLRGARLVFGARERIFRLGALRRSAAAKRRGEQPCDRARSRNAGGLVGSGVRAIRTGGQLVRG